MKFALLIYRDEKAAANVTPAEMQAEGAEYEKFTKSIIESGNFVDGDPLEPTSTAKSVQVRDGKTRTTDGPADSSLQLGAYYKVEAKNAEEAVEMAARIPGARYGTIEVRPVWEFN